MRSVTRVSRLTSRDASSRFLSEHRSDPAVPTRVGVNTHPGSIRKLPPKAASFNTVRGARRRAPSDFGRPAMKTAWRAHCCSADLAPRPKLANAK
jgi:hypothetical protein